MRWRRRRAAAEEGPASAGAPQVPGRWVRHRRTVRASIAGRARRAGRPAATSSGAVGDGDDGAALGEAASTRVDESSAAVGVEVGGGLVERGARARSRARRGPGRAGPAARRTARTRRRRAVSERRGQPGDDPSRPTRRRASQSGRRRRRRLPSSGRRAASRRGRKGRWVTRWARPASTRTGGGRAQPGRRARAGWTCPTPDGAGDHGEPGPAIEVRRRRAPRRRGARVAVARPRLQRRRRRSWYAAAVARCGVRRRRARRGCRRGPAAPSAAAWNSAPTRRIGQYASGASRIASSPACSVIEPWASRRPTVTATRATEIVASSSSAAERQERQPQGAHRRHAGAARLTVADGLDLALGPAVADQGRQAAHDVEEVAGQRRRAPPSALGRRPGSSAR